jgi:hypothetical protein
VGLGDCARFAIYHVDFLIKVGKPNTPPLPYVPSISSGLKSGSISVNGLPNAIFG